MFVGRGSISVYYFRNIFLGYYECKYLGIVKYYYGDFG